MKKAKKKNKLKAYKIIFRAFDRVCTEYFRQTETEENIHKELKNLCETYYIIKEIKVLLPLKKEEMLWEHKRRTIKKLPTQEELDKVDANIKLGTKK